MMIHATRFMLLTAALGAVSTFAAEKPAPAESAPKSDSKAVVREAMSGNDGDDIQYVDDKQCHVKMGDSDEVFAVIPMLVAAHSMSQNQAAIRLAIDKTIRQGCDIHELDRAGLQPLNAAILFADPKMVRFLLEKGADPYLPIERPKSPIDGLNSFQFAERVEAERAKRNDPLLTHYPKIREILNQYH